MNWRELVLRVMRVPPTPEPPPGSPPRVFRAAPNFFTLRVIRWALTQFAAIIGLIWALYFLHWVGGTHVPRFVIWFLRIGEVFAWLVFLFEVFFGWAMVRLEYELRWYMLSDRAIRIREGIANVREKTIALANVQNIAIRQGPLQRFLGIADVEVKTAGGGGSASEMESKKHRSREPMHVAYFRGVDNAEEIRDLVREGVRMQRNAGLGDPDDVHDGVVHASGVPAEGRVDARTTPLDAAIDELLAEARALRALSAARPANR